MARFLSVYIIPEKQIKTAAGPEDDLPITSPWHQRTGKCFVKIPETIIIERAGNG
jgi:hypothetical protein